MATQFATQEWLGWAVIVVGAVVTIATVAGACYWAIRPGETEPEHPKRIILRNDR